MTDQDNAPISQEELRAALAEELAKVMRKDDGWVISNVTLNGVPVELPPGTNLGSVPDECASICPVPLDDWIDPEVPG